MNKLKENIPELLYLILILIIGLVPNLGALDRVATQWLYLSILNTAALSFFLFEKKYGQIYKKNIFNFKPFLFLLIFVIWGILSFFYALNPTEVIVKSIRWIQLPITLYILISIISVNKFNFVRISSIIITLVLLAELYFSYSTYFDITSLTKYDFSYANIIKGATGNKNINASSTLIKVPFVLFLLYKSKPFIIKLFFSLIIAATFYLVLILSARAAIISLILVTIFLLIQNLTSLKLKSKKTSNSSILVLLCIMLPIIFFTISFSGNNSASIVNRVSTINTEDTSTQQRIRYYKHSLNHLIENPILGTGLGNWKIKSIEYDKNDIEGYIIPYHTHNDFLEISAELGIPGILFYLMIFVFTILIVFSKNVFTESFNINTIIILSGVVYFIDANLNFPHARPVMQIPFLMIIAFTFYQYISSKKNV